MSEALKDTLFSPQAVENFAAAVKNAWFPFEKETFLEDIYASGWEDLALKERMRRMTILLSGKLPAPYRFSLEILRKAAVGFKHGGFTALVFCDFVEVFGLDDWEVSIPALEQFTCLGTAEFAVRPFLLRDLDRMLSVMTEWSVSPVPDLRRLSSEGCRPRLPWGLAVPLLRKNPEPLLPILENLKIDPVESVRRSVANNLNDISKDHPTVPVGMLRKWRSEDNPYWEEMSKRALRTLVKQGYPSALEMAGFNHGGSFEVHDFSITPQSVPSGGEISFSFTLLSTGDEPQNIVIDYVIYHMRANGSQTPKVFKLTTKTLSPGESAFIKKKHSFAPITTRRYYPGKQSIMIQVNGLPGARLDFVLEG